MTRNIVPIGRGTPVAEAVRLMLDSHIGGLPVMDAVGQLVGVLSKRRFVAQQRGRNRAAPP